MRTLLLMRGAPASGKSQWIRDNNLEAYTLEADHFRMLLRSPVISDDSWYISQKDNESAWKLLLDCLEQRMSHGDFIVLDATHTTPKSVNGYKELINRYKYSVYYYEQEATLEECLARNASRLEYKRVPEQVIRRMYKMTNNHSLPNFCKKITSIDEINNYFTVNVTEKYDRIRIIGDIHACYTVLQKAITPWDEKTLYIFCGDYLERGIENKGMLYEMMRLSELPNTIMLEGNHEKHIKNFAFNTELNTSKGFLKEVIAPIIKDMSKKEINSLQRDLRLFYKRLRQCYPFIFHGKKYLVSHGGISYVPNMTYISTDTFIKGYGSYETDIAKIYDKNYKNGLCQDFIQIHGHRDVPDGTYSYCLEGEVEFGGELKYIDIVETTFTKKGIQNDIYDKNYMRHDFERMSQHTIFTQNEDINIIGNSKLVKVKSCEPNLYSLNFTPRAFHKRQWNDCTVQARGLFVDRITGDVKLRSYNKFFNIGERPETQWPSLADTLSFPVEVRAKENGFLAILGVINNEFVFASKSTTKGSHVTIFKDLFLQLPKEIQLGIKELLIREDCSIIFEVISSQDTHIIRYEKDHLFILDLIPNSLDINGKHVDVAFSKHHLQSINELLKVNTCNFISIVNTIKTANSIHELTEVLNEQMNSYKPTEGIVLVDKNGFMAKFKGSYYSDWKYRRNRILEPYQETGVIPYDNCKSEEDLKFAYSLAKLDFATVKTANLLDVKTMLGIED
ncbi:RNA ligase [Veillonella rodentium]|uniref:Serine/threonine-specific protein phosphatase 2 n=1 Tax=Veillonella rodentium TaxID=248315 RepID=A0A239YVY2_9FIRM|nr:RNA ligase [Veillonella rodentium]SNV62942.1 serine/threonine-specific protein phosphatase 2 [Veillonella rodentium]